MNNPVDTDVPFDVDAVAAWLHEVGVCDGPIRLRGIGDGLSNLTYAVTTAEGTVVLRRPPPPPLPRGANDVLREARILQALTGTDVPVPRVLAVAGTGRPMDVPCYVMEHLDGEAATTELPPALDDPSSRAALAESVVDVLVALHAVDWRAHGLADLGRPDGFLDRQLDRLPRLIADADGALPAPFAALRDRLRATVPRSGEAALTHGDLRFGNVMIGRDAPARILGVLDWELAGIGDPLADVGYTLATYAVPGEPLHALTAMSTISLGAGFPSRSALADRYAAATGRDLAALPWYEAFALFKVAVFFEYNRRKATTGDGDPYYARPGLVDGLLDACERFSPS